MASTPVTKRRLSDWSFDLLISAAVHRLVIARKAIAAARAQLAECDADAKAAGLDLRTLRRASQKATMTANEHKLEQDADAYVHLMRTVAIGACSEEPTSGAFPPVLPARIVSHLQIEERGRWRPTTQTNT